MIERRHACLCGMPRVLALVMMSAAMAACAGEPPPCRVAADALESVAENAGCLVRSDDRILVMRHRLGGALGVPGGTALPGESAQCTAARETWEETGLEVEVGRLVVAFDTPFRLYDCRLVTPLPGGALPGLPAHARAETAELFWARPDELEDADWRYPEQLPVLKAALGLEAGAGDLAVRSGDSR